MWLVAQLYLGKAFVASNPEIAAWSWNSDWICALVQLYNRRRNAYIGISRIRRDPKLKLHMLFSVQMKISCYLNMTSCLWHELWHTEFQHGKSILLHCPLFSPSIFASDISAVLKTVAGCTLWNGCCSLRNHCLLQGIQKHVFHSSISHWPYEDVRVIVLCKSIWISQR